MTKQPEDGWWFIFCGDEMLVKEGEGGRIPSSTDVSGLMTNLTRTHGIGRLDGKPCYASEVSEEVGRSPGHDLSGVAHSFGHP